MALPADTAVPLAVAASALRVSPATVRRWLRDGAPAVRPGAVGRNHGARVIVADLERWRRGDTPDVMQHVASALVDVLRRDAGEGLPAHRHLNIRRREAAALLAIAFERIYRAVEGGDAPSLPAEIEHAVRDLSR